MSNFVNGVDFDDWDGNTDIIGFDKFNEFFYKFNESRNPLYGEKNYKKWFNDNEETLLNVYNNMMNYLEVNNHISNGLYNNMDFRVFTIFVYNYML